MDHHEGGESTTAQNHHEHPERVGIPAPHSPWSDRLREVDQTVRDFVTERPLTSVAVAVGLGFLVGKIVTRRRGD